MMMMMMMILLLGDDEPPLNLVSAAAARGSHLYHDDRREDDYTCVEIYGHEYTIDSAADFSNILQPSYVTGNDVVLVGVVQCCIYFVYMVTMVTY